MEYLRSSVNLRAYGQRDPLVEYKREGLTMFQQMESSYAMQVENILPNLKGADNVGEEARLIHSAVRSITAGKPVPNSQKFERNDKVVITDGKEKREMKYKKAEPLLVTGKWKIAENQ